MVRSNEKDRPKAVFFVNILGFSGRCRRREAVAAAQRRNFEVEWSVFGVAAFIDQTVRNLMRSKDGRELCILLVSFAEVGTESTLSTMNCRHNNLLGSTPSVCKV